MNMLLVTTYLTASTAPVILDTPVTVSPVQVHFRLLLHAFLDYMICTDVTIQCFVICFAQSFQAVVALFYVQLTHRTTKRKCT